MKKYYNLQIKMKEKWLLLWLLLILPIWGLSQSSGITIGWNAQVGCTEFISEQGEKPQDNFEVWEEINMGHCVRFCEFSRVKYTVNPGNTTMSSVNWGVAGGTIISTTSNPYEAIIEWGNAGNGAINITIQYANGTQETKSICVEKIDSPKALFAIAGLGGHDVCMNTPVYFDNLSTAGGGTALVSYEWDFGDGSPTSSVYEPMHTYTTGGVKIVKLKVTNQCNCSQEYEMEIHVNIANPIDIACASVVCEGSIETYTANNTCKGKWKVIGGTIINTNGNVLTVQWDQIDPTDGFGYVMYQSECGCPAWTTLKIPVITKEGIIQGPTNVCTEKQYQYSMPRWPTTQVQWDVTGPGAVQASYNAQRNEIFLKFSTLGTYTLFNYYENTLLKCGGRSNPKTILVTAPLIITGGQPEVCVGNNLTFNSNAGGNAVWKVMFNGNVVHTETNVSLSYHFPNAGTYIVTASSPNGGCTGDGVVVQAIPLPPIPSGTILGPEPVCVGVPYTYTINPTNAGYLPIWSVTGGVIQGSNTGNSVTVVFSTGAPGYAISVQNRTTGGLGCLSNKKTRTLPKVNLDSITITAPNTNNTYCPSSSATFVANFNGIIPDDFSWSFASSNFGSLLPHPSNPHAIIVNFNEISSGIYQSKLRLIVKKCGITKVIEKIVILQQLPVISINGGTVCEGSPTIPITVNIPTNITSGMLTFTFPGGATPQQMAITTGGTQTFNVNNDFVNNQNTVISQSLQVALSTPNGCNYIATTAANFNVVPELDVVITPGYYYAICPTSPYSEVLTGNIPSGITGATYQWYKNNAPILGATASTYTISNSTQPSPAGIYYLVVTANGCSSTSQDITVVTLCLDSPPCTISPNPNLNVQAEWTSCNTITATASFVGTPSNFEWKSSPFLQLQPGSTSTTATFIVTKSGVHSVFLTLDFNNCSTQKSVDVTKHYEPDFKASISCNTNGTYNVTLTDTSLLTNITSGQIGYSYTINGGNQQNGQVVTYNNLQPGQQYAFAIKLTGQGAMPDCTFTQNITMPKLPSMQFTVSQTTVCKGEKIILSIPPANFLPNHIYKWKFAGTAFIASGPVTEITFNIFNPNSSLYLEVTTPDNCVFTSNPVNIQVNQANISNSMISGSNLDVCATSTNQPQLTVPYLVAGNPISNYEWMNGNQSVASGPSPVYQPTQSGSYWVILTDAVNGCKDKSSAGSPVSVVIRSTPQVSIVGNSQVCQNNMVTLQGVVTDNNLNYEWTMSYNGGASAMVQTGTSATPVVHTSGPLAVGTYVYTLKVWVATDPSCFGTSSFTVTVNPPPSPPQAQFQLQSCQPYSVLLYVQNPQPGTYNWSNGQTGSSIVVNTGGIYNVIYTAPSGCSSSYSLMVPHSLEDLMWIFPIGCYDLCPRDGFIIGPRGSFDHHEWQYFGNNQQGGGGLINPYWSSQTGSHQLFINHGGCQLTSGTMNMSPSINNPDCPPKDCKLDAFVRSVKREGNTYLLFGQIMNFGTQAITVSLTSANNYGVYAPSSITIPAGGSYQMNPVIFYPGANFPGGADTMQITGANPDCTIKVDAVMGAVNYAKVDTIKTETTATFGLLPNPAKEEVSISYDTGNDKVEALSLYIYDRSGNLQHQQKLQKSKGEVKLKIQHWLQGLYLVSITTTGEALQGKLLKE